MIRIFTKGLDFAAGVMGADGPALARMPVALPHFEQKAVPSTTGVPQLEQKVAISLSRWEFYQKSGWR
jgi:hypothetical protein